MTNPPRARLPRRHFLLAGLCVLAAYAVLAWVRQYPARPKTADDVVRQAESLKTQAEFEALLGPPAARGRDGGIDWAEWAFRDGRARVHFSRGRFAGVETAPPVTPKSPDTTP
jgi:hypothetical protein